jgi:hypothetical protein
MLGVAIAPCSSTGPSGRSGLFRYPYYVPTSTLGLQLHPSGMHSTFDNQFVNNASVSIASVIVHRTTGITSCKGVQNFSYMSSVRLCPTDLSYQRAGVFNAPRDRSVLSAASCREYPFFMQGLTRPLRRVIGLPYSTGASNLPQEFAFDA